LRRGGALGPWVLGMAAGSGTFHVKAAGLIGSQPYFATKINAN